MQAKLAQFCFGRAILHLVCACRDHKYYWHWLGIRREMHACADRHPITIPSYAAPQVCPDRAANLDVVFTQP
jgi:hypothetical protein